MISTVDRYWRIFGTGVSFLAFGVGGLALRVTVFPVLALAVRDGQRRQRYARTVIRLAFRLFIDFMRGLRVLRYDIVGRDLLRRDGLLVIANHPTLIDTVFLMAFVENADCVINARLWSNPFTRTAVRMAGWVRSDSGAAMVDSCVSSLERGGNLVIFPQGTRTEASGDVHLKRGAAQVAVRGARNVTPVIIRCTPPTLNKGSRWWQVPPQRAQFTIEVGQDIAVQPFIAQAGEPARAVRTLNAHLEWYFSKEQGAHAVP